MLSNKTIEMLNAYRSGVFGYDAIEMNARYTYTGTDFVTDGSETIPGVIARNVGAWNSVDHDGTYVYDSKMIFPIPKRNYAYHAIHWEISAEVALKQGSANTLAILAVRIKDLTNGTTLATLPEHVAVLPSSGSTLLERKIMTNIGSYNMPTSYTPHQYAAEIYIQSTLEYRVVNVNARMIVEALKV